MSLLAASAIIVLACAATCTLLSAVRRRQSGDSLLHDTTRGAAVYGVVGTSFAVLLAFVVFVAFQSYDTAKVGAQRESNAVVEDYRAAEFFDARSGQARQALLTCYGRSVIHDDWPAMRDGERSSVTSDWSFRLQDNLRKLRVTTPKETAAFANVLDIRDERIDARRQRLAEGDPIITTPVWFFLIIGALVNIFFVLLFIDRRGESLTTQNLMMASVTVVVTSGLLLVWFLDHPYENHTGGIQPVEMERALMTMEEEHAVRPPCDADGRPLPGAPRLALVLHPLDRRVRVARGFGRVQLDPRRQLDVQLG